ncbi:MAG: ABC-F family ATP-binding cassette domain-containing protein [Clostridiales bacterium]|nr:ABC-F family ATP-binding cassette domain-containing protein [Clostridiales bacterium]
MVILSATNISKSYGTNNILSDVSFIVNKGDTIGIVGDNGAGKTTLLNILSGELQSDSGDFYISPQISIGYLKQNDNFLTDNSVYSEMLSIFSEVLDIQDTLEEMANEISQRSSRGEDVTELLLKYDKLGEEFKDKGGFSYQSEITGILTSMAFPQDYYDKKISTLSGGERTRLALASLLLKKPDLLLLDEPTNHLDIGTLKWLEQYLKSYPGTLIIISHDRYFLDQTVNRIFEIQNQRLRVFEGNYSNYVEAKRRIDEEARRKYDKQRREIERQEEIIRRFKQHGTEKLAKRAQSREKRLKQIERLEKPIQANRRMKLTFKEKYKSGSDCILAENLSISFNGRVLFKNLNLDVKRGERICIVGPNGIGKTTLLKLLMQQLEPDTGYVKHGHNVLIGYYDQGQQILNKNKTVLEELHDAYRLYSETELRNLLGRFLFQGDDVFKKVESLSGGERARLSLLKIMLSGANLLLMDEPTNHLDISSKEVFEDALLDFPGTAIIVSHDRYLLNKIPTRIIELSMDGIHNYLGSYDYYMEKKQSIESTKGYLDDLGKITLGESGHNKDEQAKLQRMYERKKKKELEAKRRRQERELNEVEEQITNLETRISEIEEEMCKEEILTDYQALTSYSEELERTKEKLEEYLNRWTKLHDIMIKV